MRAVTAARALTLLLGVCWVAPAPDALRGSDQWRTAVVSADESPFDIAEHRLPPRPPEVPAAPAPPASLAATIEQLKATGDPRDAYQAFRLIAKCVRARALARGDDHRLRLRESCQDITAVQIAARLPLVEKAARAGVHGAVTARIGEGPFGDPTALEQRPDDPLVTEWVEYSIASVKSAATRDDVEAILQLALLSLNWELDEIARLKLLVQEAAGRNL
jgi:hypothetical protein